MATKFYVATTLSNADQAIVAINRLQDFGHELTYDWTKHGYLHDKEDKKDAASKELKGVADADLLLVIWPGGGGTHIEIGYALAMQKTIIFVAPNNLEREVSFYQHENVLRIEEMNKAIEVAHKYLSEIERSLDVGGNR